MKFNCSKCGSDNVYEQHSIMIPMNEKGEWEFHEGDCRAEGVFYCDDCQGLSRPVKEEEVDDYGWREDERKRWYFLDELNEE